MINLFEYDNCYLKYIAYAIHRLAKEKDPVLKMIQTENSHTIGPMLNSNGHNLVPSETFKIETIFILSREAILSTNLGALVEAMNSSAEQEVGIIAPKLFETLEKLCDVFGQSFNYGGKPLTVDTILDAIEHMEYDFDEEGNPSEKMLIMSPDMAESFSKLEWTLAHQERYDQIIEQKRRTYFVEKRSRRIP